MKKTLIAALSMLFVANLAWADCAADATAKKLAGAAKASFMKKCEADAKAAAPAPASDCAAKAAEKKLAGAAKGSFMKKCEADAKGAAPAAAPANAAKGKCEAQAA